MLKSIHKKFTAKTAIVILLAFFLITCFQQNSNAAGIPQPIDQTTTSESSVSNTGYTTQSINTSFTLNFSQSTIWVLDFNNSAFLINHDEVEVKYISNTPANPSATVKIELYQEDPDSPGMYEPISASYTYTGVTTGSTIDMDLPEGSTLTNYRVVFTRTTSSTTSGEFSVKTH